MSALAIYRSLTKTISGLLPRSAVHLVIAGQISFPLESASKSAQEMTRSLKRLIT